MPRTPDNRDLYDVPPQIAGGVQVIRGAERHGDHTAQEVINEYGGKQPMMQILRDILKVPRSQKPR